MYRYVVVVVVCWATVGFVSSSFGQVADDDADFFWTEVVGSWNKIHDELSGLETTARRWVVPKLVTQRPGSNPAVVRFFLVDGMQKIEWVKGDSVTHAFGHDNEDKFAAASNDEGEMFAVRLEKKVRTFENQDPLVRDTTLLYAAISVHPGRPIHFLKRDRFDLTSFQRDTKRKRLNLSIKGKKERFELVLDEQIGWAIVEWQYTFGPLEKPFLEARDQFVPTFFRRTFLPPDGGLRRRPGRVVCRVRPAKCLRPPEKSFPTSPLRIGAARNSAVGLVSDRIV